MLGDLAVYSGIRTSTGLRSTRTARRRRRSHAQPSQHPKERRSCNDRQEETASHARSARPRWRSARDRRSARRSRCRSRAAAASATRSPAAPRSPRTRARCGANPAGAVALPTMQVAAAVIHVITPSIKFQQQRLAAGVRASRSAATAATPASYRCVPNMYIVGADQPRSGRSASASTCRSASTTEYDDGWLGRYQAPQVEDQDDQRQPGDLVEASTTSFAVGVGVNWQQHQGDVDQQRATTRAALAQAAQPRPRGGLIPPAQCRGDRRGDARARLERRRSTATTGRGAGTSASLWDITPQHARRRAATARRSSTTSTATSASTIRR